MEENNHPPVDGPNQPNQSPKLAEQPLTHSQNQDSKGKKKIVFGIAALVLIAVIFVVINIIMTALGLNRMSCFDCGGFGLKEYPSPTPDATANWKTYNSDGFSIRLPEGWLQESNGNPKQYINYDVSKGIGTEFNPKVDSGKLKIEVYEDTESKNISEAFTKQKNNSAESTGDNGSKWTIENINVYGQNSFKVETGKTTFIITQNPLTNQVFLISFGLDFANYKSLQDQILSTFTFIYPTESSTPTPIQSVPTCIPRPACLDETPRCMIPESDKMCPPGSNSKYTCPKSEYVDCMPMVGPEGSVKRPECEQDYLNWAQKNCPGFKGAAL